MTSAHIASIPTREELLKITLNSVIPFVDHVFVSLNGYKHVPTWFNDIPTISYNITDNSFGDAFKFASVNKVHGLAYILDDDLVYTPTFFVLLQQKVEQYQCPVSLHGKVYPRPFTQFKTFKENYRCLGTVVGDHLNIDVIGTGTMCYKTDMVNLSLSDFKVKNMSDVWFSKLCKEQGVPMVVAEHRIGIVRYLNPVDTIWRTTKDHSVHNKIIKEFLK